MLCHLVKFNKNESQVDYDLFGSREYREYEGRGASVPKLINDIITRAKPLKRKNSDLELKLKQVD